MSQSVAILVSLCMVGMTVVPSSLIPCCCKSTDCSALRETVRENCCAMPDSGRSAKTEKRTRTCCNPEPVKVATACPAKVLKQACPKCRCLEQMQVVALSGYSTFGVSGKIHPATQSVTIVDPLSIVAPTADGVIETSPPAIHPLSFTCSLRC